MKIYTKTGDDGKTGILGGRVSKADKRIEAYGAVDELNAHLGLIIAQMPQDSTAQPGVVRIVELLISIQSDLFCIGAELASVDPVAAGTRLLDPGASLRLEACIDTWDEGLPELKQFILPGGVPGAAHLQLARTVCRRAERCLVALFEQSGFEPEQRMPLGIYLNRLGDLLFVLARAVNCESGCTETPWTAPTSRV